MSEKKKQKDTLVILGRYDCPRVTHLKSFIEELVSKVKDFPVVEPILCFETEFEAKRESLLKENLDFLKYQKSPIIYLQDQSNKKTLIGSLEEFQKYAVETYLIHDIRKTSEFEEETKKSLANFLDTNGNKYVYMNFSIEDEEEPKSEKVIFELFKNKCPVTAENFLSLCVGFNNEKGKKICYQNSIIHRVSKYSFIQGGDIREEGSKSIYEKEFNDEHYDIKHDIPGILGMVKRGNRNHTNECQFYITLCPLKSFDNNFVAFGRVIQGFDTIQKIGALDTHLQRPIKRVVISECGEYKIE